MKVAERWIGHQKVDTLQNRIHEEHEEHFLFFAEVTSQNACGLILHLPCNNVELFKVNIERES